MLNADDEFAFRGVHAVQTSTQALGAILRTRNPEVMVFPNMVRVLPDVRDFLDPQVLTLFFGALNRERDWAPLMPALNEVAEKAGERLRFRVRARPGFLRRAAHAAQAVHADLRLRHVSGAARTVRDLADAAGGHAVQSRQVGSQVHRGRCLSGGVAGEPHRVCRQHRGRPYRTAVPQRRASCTTGCCAWSRCRNWRAVWATRRVTTSPASACSPIRWRRASRGTLALGAAGGIEQRSICAASGGATLGRRRIGGNGDTALTLAAAGARLPSYGKSWRLLTLVLSLGFSPQARQT